MRQRPFVVAARVTPTERAMIAAAAEEAGIPVSEFILRSILARAMQRVGRTTDEVDPYV